MYVHKRIHFLIFSPKEIATYSDTNIKIAERKLHGQKVEIKCMLTSWENVWIYFLTLSLLLLLLKVMLFEKRNYMYINVLLKISYVIN